MLDSFEVARSASPKVEDTVKVLYGYPTPEASVRGFTVTALQGTAEKTPKTANDSDHPHGMIILWPF